MNRTMNRRFVSKRIKIPPFEMQKLLFLVKQKNNFTWTQLAQKFDVCEHVARYEWRHGKTTVPSHIFNKICKLAGVDKPAITQTLEPWWGQKIGKKSKHEDIIRLPDLKSPDFAEFYGALLGDGCIYKKLTSLCITCNSKLDKEYVENRLVKLCMTLFGIKPKIYFVKGENTIRLILNSSKIATFLNKLGFPNGVKNAARIKIPKEILDDKQSMFALLRGLIDTDGGVHAHPNTRIMLEFTSTHKDIIKIADSIFKLAQIPAGNTPTKIQIYGVQKLQKYFTIIGSSNPRNIVRYVYLTSTSNPVAKDTESLLKEYTGKFTIPFMDR